MSNGNLDFQGIHLKGDHGTLKALNIHQKQTKKQSNKQTEKQFWVWISKCKLFTYAYFSSINRHLTYICV